MGPGMGVTFSLLLPAPGSQKVVGYWVPDCNTLTLNGQDVMIMRVYCEATMRTILVTIVLHFIL